METSFASFGGGLCLRGNVAQSALFLRVPAGVHAAIPKVLAIDPTTRTVSTFGDIPAGARQEFTHSQMLPTPLNSDFIIHIHVFLYIHNIQYGLSSNVGDNIYL